MWLRESFQSPFSSTETTLGDHRVHNLATLQLLQAAGTALPLAAFVAIPLQCMIISLLFVMVAAGLQACICNHQHDIASPDGALSDHSMDTLPDVMLCVLWCSRYLLQVCSWNSIIETSYGGLLH